MGLFKKEVKLDENRIPKHIAFIMDGNGRWANKRGLVRTAGHKVGFNRIFDMIDACSELKVEAITVFAFSTENWKRSKDEIDYIFKLLEELFDSNSEIFNEKNVKIRMVGTLDRLTGEYDSLKEKMITAIERSKNNTGLILNVAFNYGSHDEIVRAVQNISKDVKDNKLDIKDINENLFEDYLMTKGLPNIDLMIRTSGEVRLSNFLLWQLAYSELVFTKTYWPDFDSNELKKCIYEFQHRDRKFGNVK